MNLGEEKERGVDLLDKGSRICGVGIHLSKDYFPFFNHHHRGLFGV